MKNNVSSILATPHELDNKSCQAIATALNLLVADCFALFIKTKNFHWHMSGTHFRDYHLLLDTQAAEIFAMIDILAERVRKLGNETIKSISEIANIKTIQDSNDDLTPKEMLNTLLVDNKKFVANIRKAHHICSEKEDFGSTGLLEDFIEQTETRIWFLFETLS